MTVAEMLSRISSRELSEWLAYSQIEPFGEERADLRAGIVASTVFNVNRGKGQKARTPQEFMPQFDRPERDPEEMVRIVEQLNAAFGGRDLRN